MPIKKGNKVKVDYTGKLKDGTVFDSSQHGSHSHPLEFEVGAGQVIEGFDEAVMGMEKGEEKEVTIAPEQAYGEKDPSLQREVPKNKMPKGIDVKPGMILGMNLPDGQQMQATVSAVTDSTVTIDMNHPLAGKTLIFLLKVVDYS